MPNELQAASLLGAAAHVARSLGTEGNTFCFTLSHSAKADATYGLRFRFCMTGGAACCLLARTAVREPCIPAVPSVCPKHAFADAAEARTSTRHMRIHISKYLVGRSSSVTIHLPRTTQCCVSDASACPRALTSIGSPRGVPADSKPIQVE